MKIVCLLMSHSYRMIIFFLYLFISDYNYSLIKKIFTMEINDQNLDALATYLRKTLSPNGDERAEGKLTSFKSILFFFY